MNRCAQKKPLKETSPLILTCQQLLVIIEKIQMYNSFGVEQLKAHNAWIKVTLLYQINAKYYLSNIVIFAKIIGTNLQIV